jgi:hypothetical protein
MLARLTGGVWLVLIAILVFNVVVELPHFDQRENLGLGPKARERWEYERYQSANEADRFFIREIRERRGAPPIPTPPVDEQTPWQHVAALTRTWLSVLLVAVVPLSLATLCVTGKTAATRAITTMATMHSRRRPAQRAPDGQSGPPPSYSRELINEIVAELASDVFWKLIGRKRP